MPASTGSRFSLTDLGKSLVSRLPHSSKKAPRSNVSTSLTTSTRVPESQSQTQGWQQWQIELKTAATLRDILKGYLSEMEALGQHHAVPTGLTDDPEPLYCKFMDHSCPELREHVKEFSSHYPTHYREELDTRGNK
jgi:hypothetical protein